MLICNTQHRYERNNINTNKNKISSSLQKLEEMYCIICEDLQINIINYNFII